MGGDGGIWGPTGVCGVTGVCERRPGYVWDDGGMCGVAGVRGGYVGRGVYGGAASLSVLHAFQFNHFISISTLN